jgi:hypothetical protein
VITSAKSGAAELVREGNAGLVCSSRDVAALVAHMRALEDPAARERMGENARNAALPLTPEAMTLALVLLYKELLEASARQQQYDAARRIRARQEAVSGKARVPADTPPAAAREADQDPAAPAGEKDGDAKPVA